jgi:hypothetical protein
VTSGEGSSTYQKKRARAHQAKFDIPYTRALRLVRAEMAKPGFHPQDPIPDQIDPNGATS